MRQVARFLCLVATVTLVAALLPLVLADSASAAPVKPSVSRVSATSGPIKGGTRVTVTGKHFAHVKSVSFGSVHGTRLKVSSSTRLTVTAPKHVAGRVNVRVATKSGVSAVVAKDHFTYVAPPSVARLSVASGWYGGGARVTITGANLTGVTRVDFGRTAGRSVKVLSRKSLQVTTPAHPVGTVNVQVVTKYGTSAVAVKDHFRFVGWALATLPLPSDASTTAQRSLLVSACWKQGGCAAVGNYTNRAGDGEGVLWRLSGAVWTAVKAPLPTNKADNPDPLAEGMACATSGACVASATYTAHISGSDTHDGNLMWTLSPAGTWTARNLPMPSDFDGSFVNINSVACGGAQCAGEGQYGTAGEGGAALWTLTGNAWRTVEAPLPGDHASEPFASITGISCDTSGTCAAAGTYSTATTTHVDALWKLSGTTWTVTHPALPTGATSFGPTAQISCGGGGLCTAVLAFTERHGSTSYGYDALWTLSGGRWASAALSLPSGADTTWKPTIDVLSCTTSGRCGVAGRYLDSSGNGQAVLWARSSKGTWSSVKAKVFTDAAENPRTRVSRLSCATSGVCIARGTYTYHVGGSDGPGSGLLWTFSAGTWTLVKPFVGTSASQSVFAVSCSSDACVALVQNFTPTTGFVSSVRALYSGGWHTARLPVPSSASSNPQTAISGITGGAAAGCLVTGTYTDRSFAVHDVAWVFTS